MAKVTITFTDEKTAGDVNINTEFDPMLEAKDRPTPAQSAALICLKAITKASTVKG